jgi:hypothetical protein
MKLARSNEARRRLIIVALAVGLLAIVIFVLMLGPYLVIAPRRHGLNAKEVLKAEGGVRTALIQAAGVIGLLGGLMFTYRTYRLSQTQQVTDRFAKAVEQLGDNSSESVRIGGIYALERLIRDSKFDQPTIVEVLAAFVRGRMPLTDAEYVSARGRKYTYDEFQLLRVDNDVQAVLTVLGRRPRHDREHPIDLRSATSEAPICETVSGWGLCSRGPL